jgi:hypothetical protein
MALSTTYAGAAFFVTPAVAGAPGEVHATQLNALGTKAMDQFGNEYIYLKGVANVIEGLAVTYDEAFTTTVLAASAIGPVAWATAAIDSTSEFGWFARKGVILALQVTATADNARLGRETTDGYIGDGRASGDEIYGVLSRSTTAGLAVIHVYADPFVDDVNGA